jgi:hypothetical protein
LIGESVLAQISSLRPLRSATGGELAVRVPPDTTAAQEALSVAEAALPMPLVLHSIRCWYWGDLLAQRQGIAHDSETLYLAALLHDVGLGEHHRPTAADRVRCFTMASAAAAQKVLAESALPAWRIQAVADAIALHFNARVPLRDGPEAHLMHAAAQLDVAGIRVRELPLEVRRQVIADYPRKNMRAEFSKAMQRESIERPDSRAAILWSLGLSRLIAKNPLDR